MRSKRLNFFHLFFLVLVFCLANIAQAKVKGIYLQQDTLENTKKLEYLIKNAKNTGINTFVIDFQRMTKKYKENIEIVKNNDIHYVARIVVFPGGADHQQMSSETYREKKYQLIKQAIALGADKIQLDYIRYNTKRAPSSKNAENVNNVIKWYKQKLAAEKIPLEIDVFGITAFREEKRIGQNPAMFANHVDAICPMVYPSHYEPYRVHAKQPYQTVYSSLVALRSQLETSDQVKIYPYIELFNYRYPLNKQQRLSYIRAQLKATEDANADGWYAWSASNHYDNLFKVLSSTPTTKPALNDKNMPSGKSL